VELIGRLNAPEPVPEYPLDAADERTAQALARCISDIVAFGPLVRERFSGHAGSCDRAVQQLLSYRV
jgi:hypothetical protein